MKNKPALPISKQWLSLALTVYFLINASAFAFNTGEQVYVKYGRNTWMPGRYVSERADCFRAESSLNPRGTFLEPPSDLIEGAIEPNAEIFKKLQGPSSNQRLKYIVRETRLKCHVVNKLGGVWAGEHYAAFGDVIPAKDFKNSIGQRKHFVSGEMVFAKNFSDPESWSLHEIVSKENDCFETDSQKVLSPRDIESEEFYFTPKRLAKNPKSGESVFIRPSFSPNVWVEVKLKIKQKEKKKLILLLPYVDSTDHFEEEVDIGDIHEVPLKLSRSDFSGLTPGASVLQLVPPRGCDYVSYVPRRIVAVKTDCYQLRKAESGSGSETEAYFAEQLIGEALLTSR